MLWQRPEKASKLDVGVPSAVTCVQRQGMCIRLLCCSRLLVFSAAPYISGTVSEVLHNLCSSDLTAYMHCKMEKLSGWSGA